MQQPSDAMSSPHRTMKPAHYAIFAGASLAVVALGSFLGFCTASATSSQAPEPIPSRSIALAPVTGSPSNAPAAPSEAVAAHSPTSLTPLPMPGAPSPAGSPAVNVAATSPEPAGGPSAVAAAPEAAPAGSAKGKKTGRKGHSFIEFPDGPGEELSQASVQRSLTGRMHSGQASADELKMLQAICRQHNDSACVNEAGEALRKKAGEGAKPVAPASSG
jgi:hypothetical protein